jgi:hypothetical protein
MDDSFVADLALDLDGTSFVCDESDGDDGDKLQSRVVIPRADLLDLQSTVVTDQEFDCSQTTAADCFAQSEGASWDRREVVDPLLIRTDDDQSTHGWPYEREMRSDGEHDGDYLC